MPIARTASAPWLFVALSASACVGGDTVAIRDSGADATTSDASDASSNDATDASSSEASEAGPTYDVKSLSGLALWLDATAGVTADKAGNVSVWADQSGNANDMKVAASEPTPPMLASASLHGHAAIHFDGGAHLEALDAASLQLGAGDFSLSIVMLQTTSNVNLNYGLVFAKQANASGFPGVAVFADLPSNTTKLYGQVSTSEWVASSTTNLDDGKPRVYGFRRVGAAITIRLDGSVDGTATVDAGAVDVSAVGIPARMGAGGEGTSAGQIFTGDIAEVVLIKGSTSDADLVALETYLKGRYAL